MVGLPRVIWGEPDLLLKTLERWVWLQKFRLFPAAALLDEAHGGLAHEDFRVKLPAPTERRNIPVDIRFLDIVFRPVSGMKPLAQRSADVWISTRVEQQLRERRNLGLLRVIHPKIRLRDNCSKEQKVCFTKSEEAGG